MTGLRLAISASGGGARCALRDAHGAIIGSDGGRSRDAAPAVAALLTRAGAVPAELAAIAIDIGPGSYTGLRSAVTFARTLAAFLHVPLFEFTSFELHAAAWLARGAEPPGAALVRCVLDARRRRFHTARLALGGRVELVEPPRAIEADALLAALRTGEVVMADSGARPVVATRCAALGLPLVDLPHLEDRDLLDARLAPRPVTAEAVEPLYLMGSYADEP